MDAPRIKKGKNKASSKPSSPKPPSAKRYASSAARKAALDNQDILSEIFSFMSIDVDNSGDDASRARRAIYYAALVNRAFVHPGLDALWRVLPSLLPLLRNLPSFKLVGNQYILSDAKAEDWESIEKYAKRVRAIRLENTRSHYKVSSLVYLRLSQLRGTTLFPALAELRIRSNASVDLFSPFSMLTTDVRVLELNHNILSQVEMYGPFMAFARSTAPNITHLILRSSSTIETEPIFCFSGLECVELQLTGNRYDISFFVKLRRLRQLESLTIFLCDPDGVPPTPNATPIFQEHGLRLVHLRGSLEAMGNSIPYLASSFLVSLTMEETLHRNTSPSLEPCFRQLSELSPSVQNILISQNTSDYVLSCSELSTLRELHGLTSFEINNGMLSADETGFTILLSAFPNIKRLSLPPLWTGEAPSLSVLWRSSILPETLEELEIPFSSHYSPTQLPKDLKNRKILRSEGHLGLRKLVISSNINPYPSNEDIVHLGRLLDCAYPNLEQVTEYGTNQGLWCHVDTFRSALRETRKDLEDEIVGILAKY